VNTEREFLDIMTQLLKRAQVVFTELYDNDDLPCEQVERRRFLDKATYRYRSVSRPLFWSITGEIMFNLENDGAVVRLGEFLESQRPFSSHMNEMVGTSFESERIWTKELLEQILRYYLTRKWSFQNDGRLLKTIFSTLRQHFNSKTIASTYNQFLANVAPMLKRTSFGNIRLIRLESRELEFLCNNNAYFRQFFDSRDHHPPRPRMARLTLSEQDPRIIGEREPSNVAIDRYYRFRDIIDSLRLVSRSPIGTSGFQMESRIMPFYNVGGVMGTPSYCRPPIADELDISSLRTARATYKLLREVGRTKSRVAKLALARIESADRRDSPEDRILDLFIGFEAVVLGNLWNQSKVQGELSFRLCLTTSKYLGRDTKERDRIYRAMRNGYDLRSSIIHGSTCDASELSEAVVELSGIYKRLLLKWCTDVSRGYSPDPLKLLI